MLSYIKTAKWWLDNPYGFLDDAIKTRGLTFDLNLPVLGEVLMTGDPDLIREIVMNKNLEGVWRHPAYLGDHNAYFWRWLITRLTDQEDWMPPDVKAAETDTAPDAAKVPPAGSAPALGLPGDKEAP